MSQVVLRRIIYLNSSIIYIVSIATVDEEKVVAIVEISASVKDHQRLMKRSLGVLDWITVIVHFISGYITVAQQKHDNTFLLQIVQ